MEDIKIVSRMTVKDANLVIASPNNYSDDTFIEAMLVVKHAVITFENVFKSGEQHLVEALTKKGAPISCDVRGQTLIAAIASGDAVNLTKAQKEYILDHRESFKDFLDSTIVGPKVRAAVLAGTFPEVNGSKVSSSSESKLSISVSKKVK